MAKRRKRPSKKKRRQAIIYSLAMVLFVVAIGVYIAVKKQTDRSEQRNYDGDVSEGFKCWRGRWVLRDRVIGSHNGVAVTVRKGCRLRLVRCTVNGRVLMFNNGQLIVEGGRIQAQGNVVMAYHNTQLVLTGNGALSGRAAVNAFNRAQVLLKSGIVHGKTAIYATNSSSVVIDPGVEVRGEIRKHMHAAVTHAKKGDEPQQALQPATKQPAEKP